MKNEASRNRAGGLFRSYRTHLVLIAAGIAAMWPAARAGAAERQFPRYHLPSAVTNSPTAPRSTAWRRLDLAIGLPLRHRDELMDLLGQLQDPASTNYHRYLSPSQFAERFGPSEEDYQALIQFAKTHGLGVTGTHPNRTLLDVRGLVADVERAFHVTLRVYQHPTEARTFYAPDVAPSMDLAVPVLAVSGLDDYALPHPMMVKKSVIAPGASAEPQAGSGPGGTYMGKDFRAAYVPGVAQTGTEQAVGLLEFDGYYPTDITRYESLAGLPNVPVNKVLLNGFSGSPGSANVEVALDIDMAISMAPGLSQVLVYEGEVTDSILNRMATDNLAKQLSASWTYPIDANSQQIFLQYAAQGQSFFNASGDSDAYAGPVPPPTDDPYIIIVGGTTLTTSGPGGAWVSEKVWNWGGGTGSSGGISTRYAIPSWQQGLNMTANQGSTTMRNLPDVAMTADNVFVIADNGQELSVGGTSCASPLWAGFTSLVNQLALANGEPAVGFINPAVYGIGKGSNFASYASTFHDITVGNNENSSSPTKFLAVAGYDLCTGWGTPTGSNLITALALPEPLRITPTTGALISGPSGGPFSPAAATFSLANAGPGALNWMLVNTSSWFNVSPQSGTLATGGGAATVTVNLTAAASNLVAGSYVTTLLFTNLNDHFGQSRPVTLAVVTPPVITAQPADQAVLEGATATFNVGAGANALLYYRWLSNGTGGPFGLSDGGKISGTATSTLTISNVFPADTGSFFVVVSNAAGVASSSNALLTIVPSAPVITLQPTNQMVLPGASAAFTVAAVGNQPFTYQWQDNGSNLTNSALTSGATTSRLMLSSVSVGSAGVYTVMVSNSLGSVTSTGAVLAVIPVTAPGFNLSSLSSFASASSGQNPYAPLARGVDGKFYGTTVQGGANFLGTVFNVTSNGTLSALYSFNGSMGAILYAGLVQGRDGTLYGEAYEGGASGYGTTFRMSIFGALLSSTAFNGINGELPVAGMTLGADGNLYGTSLLGGTYGDGTLFRMTPSGIRTTLVSLDYTQGAEPSAVLVQGPDGNFYGTTELGGNNGVGTVFRMTPAGVLTTLYSFGNANDGMEPIPGLVLGNDGNFYGTTLVGGTNGFGTVFRITSGGALTTLYSFSNGNDGASPWGGLVQGADGNLYGTTQGGGTYSFGTVFSLAPNGPLTTVATFDGFNGANPSAAMVLGIDGSLFGTTTMGGANGNGTVFRLSTSGALQITSQPTDQSAFVGASVLFTVATFGSLPVTYQWQRDGTNLSDGGEIFGSASATLTLSNVSLADAAVYSVTVSNAFGAASSDYAVLEVIMSPPEITSQPASQTLVAGETATLAVGASGTLPLFYQWQENGTNLIDGGQISGSGSAALTLSNLTLANAGTYAVIVSNALARERSSSAVLRVVPPAAPGAGLSTVHQFLDGTDGAFPYSSLVQGRDGNLYGTASGGGSKYLGSFFRMTLAGATVPLYSFPGNPGGATPYGGLVQGTNNYFYGTTYVGGTNGYGTIFRVGPSGAPVVSLYSFTDGNDGAYPFDAPVQAKDGNFYGVTPEGGTNLSGSIFRMTALGALTALYSFAAGDDGAYPYGRLVQGADGHLYGTTSGAGLNGFGTVFGITTNGALTFVASFDYTNGASSEACLIQGADGSFYGTAASGGANGLGTVFRLTTNGTLTALVSFSGTNGAQPFGGLVQGTDGNLYGTTSTGGYGGSGTVFKISTNGTLTTLVWFDGFNGAYPVATLVQANNGAFYGTTAYGGAGYNGSAFSGIGTIFKLTVPLFASNPFSVSSATAGLPYSATLSGQASVPPGDALTFAKVSGPAWLTVSANGALSGTPANSDLGTNAFVVSLTDTNGVQASATMFLTVSVPVAPAFVANPFIEPPVNVGQSVSANLTAQVSDPNIGDSLTFALLSGPGWLSIATNGQISGIPGSSVVGTNTFVVSVTDALGLSNTATMYIDVYGPPAFTSNPFAGPPAAVGYPYAGTIATNATDPNAGNTLSFAVVSGPGWLTVAAGGALSGTPGSTNAGTNLFVVSATDSGGLSTNALMYVYVYTPPSFLTSPFVEGSAVSGLPYAGTIATNAAPDPDQGVGDTLTFSKASGPAWLNVAANGALSGAPPVNTGLGQKSFLVRVADSIGLGATAVLRITVTSNVPPFFSSNPFSEPFAKAGLLYTNTIATNAVEVNAGDPLTLAKVSGPAWLAVAASGALSGTPAATDAGTNAFVVSVTDFAGLSNTATLYLNVHGPPFFNTNFLNEPWANVDQVYGGSLATNVTDPDAGAALTFTKLSGPAWLTLSTNGLFLGTPDMLDAATNTFVVGVTDFGGLTNTATMRVYVNSPPSFSPMSFSEGLAYSGLPYSGSIAGNATDPDLGAGDTLTFYKVTGPAWLSVAANGALSGTPSNANLGANSFLVLVVDSGGLSAVGFMNLTVVSAINLSISQQHGQITLSWSGGNPPYQVQTAAGLSAPAWTNLGSLTSSNSLVLTPSNAAAWFRVQGH